MTKRPKITVVGAGNVGATIAHWLACWRVGDIVLLDVVEGLAEGKALDLSQCGPVEGFDLTITGGTDYALSSDSDVVIITAGLARKPGMSRDELLTANTKIVTACAGAAAKHSRDAVLLVVSNPLDAMVYAAHKASAFPTERVVGQAGVLDVARFKTFLSWELGCSVQDISALLIGGHGDDMVPLVRYTNVAGIPITELIPPSRLEDIVQRTRMGGAEVVKLLKTGSAYYTPAAATARMAESIVRDQKRVVPACAYCDKEYDIGGYFVGVPCVLGAAGVEKVIEVKLDDTERSAFAESIDHVRQLCKQVDAILANE